MIYFEKYVLFICITTDKCFQMYWITAALIIATLSVIVIIIMGAHLYKYQQKGMHYFVLTYQF